MYCFRQFFCYSAECQPLTYIQLTVTSRSTGFGQSCMQHILWLLCCKLLADWLPMLSALVHCTTRSWFCKERILALQAGRKVPSALFAIGSFSKRRAKWASGKHRYRLLLVHLKHVTHHVISLPILECQQRIAGDPRLEAAAQRAVLRTFL